MVEAKPRNPRLERILRAASSVFAERGYDGASLQEVADAAGVTKPTVYNHFGSKAALYEETVRWVHGQVLRRVEQAAAGQVGAYERILALMRVQLEFAREYSDLIRVGHSLMFLPEEVRPRVQPQELFEGRFNVALRVVQEGVAAGELQGDPRDIALTISSVIGSLSLAQALMPGLSIFREDIERRVWDVLYEGTKKR